MQLPGALLSPSSKNKKILRKFLVFQEMEISYIFLEELFLCFGKWKHRKKFLIFQGTELSYISGIGNPKNRARKIKRTHS